MTEYSRSIIDGVKKYCHENNIQLFVFVIRSKNWFGGVYDYQYFACKELASKNNIDGILLVTNTYLRNIPVEEHSKEIKELSYLPVVSYGVNVPELSSVSDDFEESLKELLEHLEKDHGCKNIFFMGPETSAADIVKRFNVFKEYVKSKGYDYKDKIIYASYVSEEAKRVLREKKITKENLPFDAIVCATDDLAFGCLDYFDEKHIKVPDDVIVTGFDNQPRCEFNKLSLTSIDMCIDDQCYGAAKLLHQKIQYPEKPNEHLSYKTKLIKRQSCGCTKIRGTKGFVEGQYFLLRGEVYKYQYFLQDLQITDDTERLKQIIINHFKNFGIESCVCCIYDELKVLKKDEKFIVPEKASVFFAFNHEKIFNYESEYKLNPSKNLYPEDFNFEDGKEVIVTSLFDHEYQYGYILYTPGEYNHNTYELISTITGTALARNSVFTEKVQETEKLSTETKSLETTAYFDEMTGVLNRHGLYKYAVPEIKSALERGLTGTVIFADMDHLKMINDKYGHEAGDRAITGEVEILKKICRTQDIIARMGGDEFVIVACGLKAVTYPKVFMRLDNAEKTYNEEHKEQFDVSLSLGFVEFDKDNNDLDVLVAKADEEQYKQKVLHHKNRT